jgi:hypothetical protein
LWRRRRPRRAVPGSTMVQKKPRTWGWKVIKYHYAKDMTDPADIALHMRGKGMQVGRTWVQEKLKKYQEDGDPNSRDVRSDKRRATETSMCGRRAGHHEYIHRCM